MTSESSEEGPFAALVEEVRREVRVVAEGHSMLHQKIGQLGEDLSKKMDEGFADIKTGIEMLVKEVREHHQDGPSLQHRA